MSSKGEKNPFTQDSNEKLDAHSKSYHNTLEWRVSLPLLPRLTLKLKSGMHLLILDFFDCCYSVHVPSQHGLQRAENTSPTLQD